MPVLNCLNTQNSVTRADLERVVTFNWRGGVTLPEFSGSSIVRKKTVRKPKPDFSWAEALRREREGIPEMSEMAVSEAGEIVPDKGKQVVHKMSIRTARKIRNKIHAMYRAGLAKSFITLTTVAQTTDKIAVRCLQKLLKLWRERWGQFNFLWVAERQENKNIHFHLVLDRFIDVVAENYRWVKLQYNSGIVYSTDTIIRKKENHQNTVASLGAFLSSVNNIPGDLGKLEYKLIAKITIDPERMNPKQLQFWLNPLDVEKINSIESLASYLASYVSKKVGDEFECSVWHCSRKVSELFTEMLVGTEIHECCIDTDIKKVGNFYTYKKDVYVKGKLKHKRGDIVLPKLNFNEHAYWTYIHNFNFANQWLKFIDEVNSYVLKGIVTVDDIRELDYFEYCRIYQKIKFRNYKSYFKLHHNRKHKDCSYISDFKKRGLDVEADFYQLGLSHERNKFLDIYTKNPQYNYKGERYYSGKKLDEKLISDINNYLKLNFEHGKQF